MVFESRLPWLYLSNLRGTCLQGLHIFAILFRQARACFNCLFVGDYLYGMKLGGTMIKKASSVSKCRVHFSFPPYLSLSLSLSLSFSLSLYIYIYILNMSLPLHLRYELIFLSRYTWQRYTTLPPLPSWLPHTDTYTYPPLDINTSRLISKQVCHHLYI